MGGRFSVGRGCGSQEGFPEEVGWGPCPILRRTWDLPGEKERVLETCLVSRSPRPLVMRNSLPLSWRREVEVW